MKPTIIPLLQQRMDKCTTEQFWAVAALTAADGFAITSAKSIVAAVTRCSVLFVLTIAVVWGVLFIIGRHRAYYKNRAAMVTLLQGEQDVPDFLKTPADPWSFNSLSGVVFYVGWVVLGCILCYYAV